MERTLWPLSYEQEHHWLLDQIDAGNPVYNRPYVLKFTGTLCVDTLQRCFNQIIVRHSILRARFGADAGIPHLTITPHEDIVFSVYDLGELAAAEKENAIKRLVLKEAQRSFDLEKDRLVRAALIRASQAENVLVLVFHHIVFDGWSAQVFLRELTLLYKSLLQKGEPSLPKLVLPYTQHTVEQRERLSDAVIDQRLGYWKQNFGGEKPDLELPFDFPRPAIQSHAGKIYAFTLGSDTVDAIKKLCRSERVTLFMYVLTVLKTVLYRYTRQQEIAIGCHTSGRSVPEAEKLIGLFVNTLPIMSSLEDTLSFRQLLRIVRKNALEAFKQELPYVKLVAKLSPARRLHTNPFFQVMLNMHNMPRVVADIPGLVVEELEYDYGTTLVDLCLKVTERSGRIECDIVYDTDLFEVGTIERLAGHFQQLVQASIDDPDRMISRLQLLTNGELSALLAKKPAVCDSKKCIHHFFEEQAALYPQKAALVCNDAEMTYGELNRRANQLAHYLIKKDVGPEVLAAVCLESSFELFICFLAVLKAGGAYLPVDLSYPAERLSFMLEDSKAAVIITADFLEAEKEQINAQPEHNPASQVVSDNLAYVMYTSGSTGKPKGVAVPHKGIVRLVKNIDYARLGPDEVFLQLTTVAFDVSAFEIYGSLLNGGKLVLIKAAKPSIAQIGQAISQHKVTSICNTPEILHMLMIECAEDLQGLRQVLSAGDILPIPLAARFMTQLPNCRLINAYGPTENSVYTTAYAVDKIGPDDRSIPIGKPIANDRVYILDKNRELLPIGITGELYAAGDGVAREYLYNPELTAERFVPDPFSSDSGDRLYRTGDMARYLPDGNIEFFGRADDQVKVRGCRIELGEIETAICQHSSVRHCVVTARADQQGVKSLLAYVVLQPGRALNANELRSFVRLKLPDYMIPSLFIPIEEVPLTPVGKIDRRALPQAQVSANSRHAVMPRTSTEQALARMWEKLLNLRAVSVTDNFFDLGGHSLLAMRLFAEIERTLHKKLSVSVLFREDTIEKLAQLIDADELTPDASSLVPIQTAGSNPPLFCVHALNGEVLSYRNLALHLGLGQPVYGLKLNVSGDGENLSIEGLAEKYVRDIKRLQPTGPYFLAGHSFGGIVAYEMARQLSDKRQEVALLVLFDTRNPQYYPVLRPETLWARWQLSFERWKAVPPGMRVSYMIRKLYAEMERVRERFGATPENRVLRKKLAKLQHAYIPGPYSGRLTIFRAARSVRYRTADPQMGWSGLAGGGVYVYEACGDHSSLLGAENIAPVAQYIAECLQRAQKAEG